MKGFNERSSGSTLAEAKKEGMPYYMGAFLAIALDWRTQAQAKAIEVRTIQALQREVTTLKEERSKLEVTYQASLAEIQKARETVKKVEEVATLRLREAD